MDDDKRAKVERELGEVLNRNSVENASDTPDWILAEFLVGCLQLFAEATRKRDGWYDIRPRPGSWRGDAGLAGYLSAALPELHETHPEAVHKAILAFRALPDDACATPRVG